MSADNMRGDGSFIGALHIPSTYAVYVRSDDLAEVVISIIAERERQDKKWGSQRHLEPLLWNAILGEEVGEVANALLEHKSPAELRKELVQVAAVAAAWIEAIDTTKQEAPNAHD